MFGGIFVVSEVNFKNQILEDIIEYQKRYPNIKNINKNEWAFNFWVLATFFNMDEELIEDNICDYNDKGIDCFYYSENSNDLYLIQNKFYEDSALKLSYVKDDFLLRPKSWLESNNYKRSEELQKIFNKYSKTNGFTLHLELYISNNEVNELIYDEIHKFMAENENIVVNIYTLDKIKEKYYGEFITNNQNLEYTIESVNKGTILNINTKDYGMDNPLDAKYVLAPVISLYRMRKTCYEKNYPLFNENIREYLGNKGINKKIYSTLMDENERKNFFYYNNGITMICDKIDPIKTGGNNTNNCHVSIKVTNPQIVNGCQTVNSIYESLNMCNLENLEEQFKNCFVMLKVLQIDRSNENSNKLKENIVRYNNSQNSIDEKTFVANNEIYRRLQESFEKRGFLLLIKQSDKNTFSQKYKNATKLKDRNKELLDKFNLQLEKVSDFMIKIDKLLQVIISFVEDGYSAYVNKPKLLKADSKQFEKINEFIKRDDVTIETLLNLYLLYLKSEKEKKESKDGRSPIAYYLITLFAKNECNNNPYYIREELNETSKISNIIKKYKIVSMKYCKDYFEKYGIDYNKMIKQKMDFDLIEKALEEVDIFSAYINS